MKQVFVDDPALGTVQVGAIYGDTYVKHVKRHIHFMRKYNGYAIQKEVVDKFNKVKLIHIIEDNRKSYRIPVDEFRRHAIQFECGHGEQYVVDEEHYDNRD